MTQQTTVSEEKLKQWFGARFPQAGQIGISNLRKPGGGFSNETWLFDLSWQVDGSPEDKPLVLRMAPSGDATFPDYDLRLQYRCMEALQGTGVPVPDVMCFEEDEQSFGVQFYLMAQIEGLAPVENPPYHQSGWLKDLAPTEQSEVWKNCIDVLVALSQVDWKSRGFDSLNRPDLGRTPLDQTLSYLRNYLAWVEGLRRPYPLLNRALAWLEANKPEQEPTSLCWGDAKLGNCLFKGSQCVAALDWEKPHLGNPVCDLAWCLMLDRALSTSIGIDRLPGFWDRDTTAHYWAEQSGHSTVHLPYYEVLSAFKFAVIMASITRVFIGHGWVPKDTDMDIKNAGTAVLMDYAKGYAIDLRTDA